MMLKQLKYLVWIFILMIIGYVDIVTEFKPILSGLILISISILACYRSIALFYFGPLFVSWRLAAVCGIVVLFNIVVGLYLNSVVDKVALSVVDSIYAYKKIHGEFPVFLSEISSLKNLTDIERNRLKYGARFYYFKEVDAFDFGYDTYFFGGKMWNAKTCAFVDVVD